MVAVNDVVAYAQLVDLAQRDNRLASPCVLARHLHAVVALENLVVGVAADLQPMVHKSLMQRRIDGNKSYSVSGLTVALRRSYSGAVFQSFGRSAFKRFEYRLKPVELLLLLGQDVYRVSFGLVLAYILGQYIKLLVEYRLRRRVKRHGRIGLQRTLFGYLYRPPLFWFS